MNEKAIEAAAKSVLLHCCHTSAAEAQIVARAIVEAYLSAFPPLRAREEIARLAYEAGRFDCDDYPPAKTWAELDALIADANYDPIWKAELVANHNWWLKIADAILSSTAWQEWRDRALKIIADENRFAATDDPRNVQLHALRIARVGTAKQILGELPLSEPVLAGAIAASFPAPPVAEPLSQMK